jgi:hypothetical protein
MDIFRSAAESARQASINQFCRRSPHLVPKVCQNPIFSGLLQAGKAQQKVISEGIAVLVFIPKRNTVWDRVCIPQ